MKKLFSILPIALLTVLILVIALLTGTVFFRVMSQPATPSAASSASVSLTEADTSLEEEAPSSDREETSSLAEAEASSSAEAETDLSAPEREPDSSASTSAEATSLFAPVSGGVPASPKASADDPYPGLYTESAAFTDDETQKVIYLTFNSSPSENTDRLLSILEQHNVKATFFVNGKNGTAEERGEAYRKILESGHTLGLHSYSCDNEKIYASVDAYLADLNQMNEEVYAATGYQANLIRFPEGSVNSFNGNICNQLTKEVTRRGYTYHDWSVIGGDAEEENPSTEDVIQQTEYQCVHQSKSVVLLHDLPTQTATAEALDRIITDMEANGYQFRALDNTIAPFHSKL